MNPFEAVAASQISSPVRSRMKGVQTRRDNMSAAALQAEKRLAEKEILLAAYKKVQRAELRAFMFGEHGKEVRGLISFLRTMSLSSAPALLTFMGKAKWVAALTERERDLVWSIVFQGIARLRETNGLTFWEDALPGDPPKVFDEVETIIRPRPTAPASSAEVRA